MDVRLITYRNELQEALYHIWHYWQQHTIDEKNGGFVGALNNDNEEQSDSPKGGVLNTRILWTFAAAYGADPKPEWLHLATRAYDYLQTYFRDKAFGGMYWSVTASGVSLEDRKQVYGQAFGIYALSEYYRHTHNQDALDWAIALYHLLEQYSFDPQYGGYHEAFSREWGAIADTRLSAKDDNAAKTMNTNLHVLEAYTNLYRVWPDKALRKQLYDLIRIFIDKIIDQRSLHQVLFFNTQWEPQSVTISYGHDIEAAWLLTDAAEVLHDSELLHEVKEIAVKLTDATIAGLEPTGGLQYEYDPVTQHRNGEKHWWVQAEAMVGFFNSWQITGKDSYLEHALHNWAFIQQYIIDHKKGEWYWGVTADLQIMPGQDKAGFWKCPYHNSRACMEIIRRINALS